MAALDLAKGLQDKSIKLDAGQESTVCRLLMERLDADVDKSVQENVNMW